MTYSVKEIYYTLQGEGAQTGRAAVFLRFAGCNLWSGLEKDRAQAVCQFCDTDFVGTDGPNGGKFADAASLARAVREQWPAHADGKPYVVCTGGEPLLQLDDAAVAALKAQGFEIGIETNGTLIPPRGIDWICVSPKAEAEQKLKHGDELKLVYPQDKAPAGAVRRTRNSGISSCSRWTMRTAPPIPRPRRPIVWPIRNGGFRCRPTNCWEFPSPSHARSRMAHLIRRPFAGSLRACPSEIAVQ